MPFLEGRERDVRPLGRLALHEGLRDEAHEVPVAGLARGEQHEIRQGPRHRTAAPRGIEAVIEADGQLAADDRLDADLDHLLGEFERAEQIARIGQRQRRLRIGDGQLDQLLERQRAFEKRIGRMNAQMHEADLLGNPGPFRRSHHRPRLPLKAADSNTPPGGILLPAGASSLRPRPRPPRGAASLVEKARALRRAGRSDPTRA